MKIMLQGLQAVTVELAGILLIVWLLFGAAWGIRTTTSDVAEWSADVNPVVNSLGPQITRVAVEPQVASASL